MQTSTDIKQLRVLIVEDDENDALLLVDHIEKGGYELVWRRVDSEPSMAIALKEPWDIVLSDYSIPGFGGMRALSMVRATGNTLPFIFVSGTLGEDAAVAAMKAGAQDYVMKGNVARLIPTIERELREARIRVERQESDQTLRKLSLAISQSADGICITDRCGHIEYVNPAFEKLTGYDLDDLQGKQPFFMFNKVLTLSPQSSETLTTTVQPFWEIKPPTEQRAIFITQKKDNSLFYEDRVVNPLLDEKQDVTHFVVTSRDITQKILTEESRRRLAEILEVTPDLVCIIHPTNRLWYLNSAGYRSLGISTQEEVRGRAITDFFPPSFSRLIKSVSYEVLRKGSWSGETVFNVKGKETPYSLVIVAHRNQSGHIRYLSVMARDISERKRFEIELQHQATHDGLTQLPNRFLLLDRFRSAIQQARRTGNQVAVLFLDLDNFKRVNDSLGHDAGDDFLVKIASRLRRCLRPQDTVARHGGDEFTIVLTDIHQPENVLSVVQKLHKEFEYPILVDNNEIYATFSIGISLYPNDGFQAEELLRHADTAMYKAKKAGSNQYCFYAPIMNARSREILSLEADLRRAIEQQEFSLFYQPQLDLSRDTTVGLEALIRWRHNHRGLVQPAEFVDLLENSGLIIPVGEWIIQEACIQHQRLRSIGFGNVRISVNVSALQFDDRHFLNKVQTLLSEYDMPPNCLELEITENLIMRDPDSTVDTLNTLRALGVRCAIDDFGTGYSSLSYLKKFPINLLKIDRTFIRDLLHDKGDSAIVEASIALAQKLDLEIVAEGVETEDQLNFLRDRQCGIAQGYFVSKPMTSERVLSWLTEQKHVA